MLRWIRSVTAITALLLAVIAVGYAYFLLIGRPIPNLNFPILPEPQPAAIVPIITSVLIMVGVGTNRLAIAWIGDTLLFVFSLLFVFGIGSGYLIVAVIQGILITILQATTASAKG
jgi:hypothetical protein